uniref:Uncharacterized protein n=1 Tax=Glossina austeni TaxID=7395 RepID=A0A1A9UCP6_GLOAU
MLLQSYGFQKETCHHSSSDEVCNDGNDKLGVIKYNSHKHIAALLEEKGHDELTLQHCILAVLIDDTDVFTLHKFGQLALKSGVLDLAEYAFETCLFRNSIHWLVEEGLLQTLCRRINMLGAFNWATKMLHQNPHSAKDILLSERMNVDHQGDVLSDAHCISTDAPKVALLAQTSAQVIEIELDGAVSEQFDRQSTNIRIQNK